jgi:CysZ protein
MIFIAFSRALRDLLLPDILKLFFYCLLAYAVGWSALSWLFSRAINAYVNSVGAEGLAVRFLSGAGGMVLAWFLFPLLYPILVSFFDDWMVAAIEREDYPQLPRAQPPFWPTLLHDFIFSLKAIGLNILCLPLYLVPFIGIPVYYALNGHLLGTQFFRMAAGRRISRGEAEALERKAYYLILFTGIAISFFSTIPVLNLAAPLIGVASMLHLFHALRGAPKQDVLQPYR